MANVRNSQFESAGWLFWGVGVAIFIGPAIYFSAGIMVPGTSIGIPIALGAVVAVLLSGVITASVNSLLHRASQKRRAAERKKTKK